MEYIVDRLEENLVVLECEDQSHLTVPAENLPDGVKEGDIVSFSAEKGYQIEREKTNLRRLALFKKQEKLFERGRSGK